MHDVWQEGSKRSVEEKKMKAVSWKNIHVGLSESRWENETLLCVYKLD